MNVLVVGGGGREHAIIKKLKESRLVTRLYCCPGNGGIAADAVCVPVKAMDFTGILRTAEEIKAGLVVVAPDNPLCAGLTDLLEADGFTVFGPNKAAAAIEGSKSYAKALMKKYGIPTADYEEFTDYGSALEYVRSKNTFPAVIKADGLALGKGVIIAQDLEETKKALEQMFVSRRFGSAADKVIIEEFLTGVEISVLAFCDGNVIRPMVSAKDHKRIFDRDLGPNTGGMGAVAPHPLYTPQLAGECMEKIFVPTMNALNSEGRPFRGVIYFGMMLTGQGPKMLEYNCRFGDPETQVVLPLFEGDLCETFLSVAAGKLKDAEFSLSDAAACCVILASGGYPGSYEKGYEITGIENCGAEVYHAGTELSGGALKTSGGRVLGVTCVEKTLAEAIRSAYSAAEKINFTDKYCRNDIGVIY